MCVSNHHYVLLNYALALLYRWLCHYLFAYRLFCLFNQQMQIFKILFTYCYYPACCYLCDCYSSTQTYIYIYMHHYNHVKLTLLLKSSDLLLPIPFNPCDLSFILAQYLVLNIDGWYSVLFKKFLIFWYSIIILLYQS